MSEIELKARDIAALPAQGSHDPVCSGGFVIGNGSGGKYIAWGQFGPEWVADRSAALWLVRRADAEALAAENEDAWLILPVERCALPPNGWACSLASGHEGPCPTIAAPTELSREAAMVVLERDASGQPTVWCDPGVVDLVAALNGAGIATVWSCDGHGHRPAVVGLKDGRQLLVLESVEALQPLSDLWPDINGQWMVP